MRVKASPYCLFLLLHTAGALLPGPASKIAVTGATGKLGREAVELLSSSGAALRILARREVDPTVEPSIAPDATAAEVLAYFAKAPNVELVRGDVTDEKSVTRLLAGTDACLALHGATRRLKLRDFLPWCNPSRNDPAHARQVNYEGVRNLILAAKLSNTCKRIIRITGKGETPWSIFSILINGLGSMAKAWNYAGETLLRDKNVMGNDSLSYTIIRPGVMQSRDGASAGAEKRLLALADDGGDLTVSSVAYEDVARLCVEAVCDPNAASATLTAMTCDCSDSGPVDSKTGARRITGARAVEGASWETLLAEVKPDARPFPERDIMVAEHHKAVRIGGIAIAGLLVAVTTAAATVATKGAATLIAVIRLALRSKL